VQGAIIAKRLRVARTNSNYEEKTVNLDSSYGYDNEGRNSTTQYPGSWAVQSPEFGNPYVEYTAGPVYTNQFDEMGRLKKLINSTAQADVISNATYNPMGELLTMSGAVNETRSYNSIGQLKQLQSAGVNTGTVSVTSTPQNRRRSVGRVSSTDES
jgi:hypothetical protein